MKTTSKSWLAASRVPAPAWYSRRALYLTKRRTPCLCLARSHKIVSNFQGILNRILFHAAMPQHLACSVHCIDKSFPRSLFYFLRAGSVHCVKRNFLSVNAVVSLFASTTTCLAGGCAFVHLRHCRQSSRTLCLRRLALIEFECDIAFIRVTLLFRHSLYMATNQAHIAWSSCLNPLDVLRFRSPLMGCFYPTQA